ncbi:FMN-linked oxidoreductase [Pisolithus microcarpus]|nr:FMN-linked oxidoreductase [Pisolithus microcarpus]
MTRTVSSEQVKRPKLEHLTSDSFRNGVFLAPMVRSGALPTRLMALKHGASLVWGPEVVDKAILHAERVVDPVTGVISYNGKSPSPQLAVQAAKTVVQDVSGVDLNCGCPKPFSTHAGMGAALLTNPDLLCDILTSLRRELPPHITVSAKIRLLPSQEDTKRLVERIVRTGVSALTVHCRTRNMRPREAALIERLREIVEFVEGLGIDIPVVANGDCQGWEDAKRVKQITGASSVMIATAAEANPSCFAPTPLQDVETTMIPSCKYIDNHWALTKFCISQFRSTRPGQGKQNLLKSLTLSGHGDLVPLLVDSESEEALQRASPASEEGDSSDDGPPMATPP